jgi:hypothetical protein
VAGHSSPTFDQLIITTVSGRFLFESAENCFWNFAEARPRASV